AVMLSAGFRQVSRSADADVLFGPRASPQAGQRVVRLFDGQLGPKLQGALSENSPALLLACRDADATPSLWELQLLNRLLIGADLIPMGSSTTTYEVRSIDDVRAISEATGGLVSKQGGASASRDVAIDVTYELLTNALLDAPVNERGEPKYAFQR